MLAKIILVLAIWVLSVASGGWTASASAERWQDKYPTLQFSRISAENEADRDDDARQRGARPTPGPMRTNNKLQAA